MVRHGHRAPHYVSRDHYDHICVIEYNTRTSSGVYRKVFGCVINITINISTLLPLVPAQVPAGNHVHSLVVPVLILVCTIRLEVLPYEYPS